MRIAIIAVYIVSMTGCSLPDTRPVIPDDADFARAERYFLEGDSRASSSILSSFIERTRHPRAYLLRGKCYSLLERYSEAVSDFQESIDRAQTLDGYIEANLGLGDVYYSSEEYASAVRVYGMLIDEYPERIPRNHVKIRYAHALLRNGSWDQGEGVLDEISDEFAGLPLGAVAEDMKKAAAVGKFYIQAGLFSKEQNAVLLWDRLLQNGFTPEIIRRTSRFAVIIGYYDKMEAARTALQRVKQSGFSKAFIKP